MSRSCALVTLAFLGSTLLATGASPPAPSSRIAQQSLDFHSRVACQKSLEEVLWRHRLWPAGNSGPRPALETVLPGDRIRAKVADSLLKSRALEVIWRRPITPPQLQAEVDRMARRTRQPEVLRALFAALENDPFQIAECLARPLLADRLIREWYGPRGEDSGVTFDEWWAGERLLLGGESAAESQSEQVPPPVFPGYSLPPVSDDACTEDSWAPVNRDFAEARRYHTAVWTGTEMIVWGGEGELLSNYLRTGLRYAPATDSWSPARQAPIGPRRYHTAVWTGTEMIVWGGYWEGSVLDNGARYNPADDSWSLLPFGPSMRQRHTAVWTGSEMIVWGGVGYSWDYLDSGMAYKPSDNIWRPVSSGPNLPAGRYDHTAIWNGTEMIIWGGDSYTVRGDGGRYNPVQDRWTPVGNIGTPPSPRHDHTAVWDGQAMIVWGGKGTDGKGLNTGGRYDPVLDLWASTSTGVNLPAARYGHTAVWTGSEMIVWGAGTDTGGRYNPIADSWLPTSTGSYVPSARSYHTAVWTGGEMIVWGGSVGGSTPFATGGRYDPLSDSWVPTSTGKTPAPREGHTAVWTGTEMIVWGGQYRSQYLQTGGRYLAASDTWTRTPLSSGTPAGRAGHTAVWTGTEMIVWGGGSETGNPGEQVFNSGGKFDPASETWTPTSVGPGVPSARGGHTAVWTGSEMIIWGGPDRSGGRYSPASDQWSPVSGGPGLPQGWGEHTAVWTGREMIVWGGGPGEGAMYTNRGSRYSPRTDTWRATSVGEGVPEPRHWHNAVWTGEEMIIYGGQAYDNSLPYPYYSLDDGARYNPENDSWTPITSGPGQYQERYLAAAVWSGLEMIVWGGEHLPGTGFINSGGRYDPALDAWSPTSEDLWNPTPRGRTTGVWGGGTMIIWGGWDGMTALNTGSRYCAPPCAARPWYRDQDEDDFGDPAQEASACSRPPGFADDNTDCDDGNASRFPGNPELCDGIDNDCNAVVDDVPPPEGLLWLTLRSESLVWLTDLMWEPVAGADGYDLMRGETTTLRSTSGDFSEAATRCLDSRYGDLLFVDADMPPPAESFWYAIRPEFCFQPGTYNSAGPGQQIDRDPGIQASPAACP